MRPYLPIPVNTAREISERYQKSMVVILAYDPEHQKTHTTTYGVSAFEKENAAACGELCALTLGGDLSKKQTHEDFNDDYRPAEYTEAMDLLRAIVSGGDDVLVSAITKAQVLLGRCDARKAAKAAKTKAA